MNQFRRDTAHLTAEQTVTRLLDRGIDLPAEVATAVDALRAHLDRGAPEAADPSELADAYAEARPEKTIDALAFAQVTATAKAVAYAEATKRLGVRCLHALTANGDNITTQLAKIAAERIGTLEQIAALSTLDVAALLRSGNNEGADLAAHADYTAGDLADLFGLRRAVTRGAEYGAHGWDCGTWRDPRLTRQAESDGLIRPSSPVLDRYIVGIRVGAGLWFPTPGAAEQQAQVIHKEESGKALATEAENFKRGQRFASR